MANGTGLNVILSVEDQILGLGEYTGITITLVASTGNQVTISNGQKASVEVDFNKNGTTPTTIAQLVDATSGTIVIGDGTVGHDGVKLQGIYYPGTVFTDPATVMASAAGFIFNATQTVQP